MRLHAFLLLAVIVAPVASFAQDKDEPRSLADEAAYLADNSGQRGWVAEEVPFTMDDGKKKAKADAADPQAEKLARLAAHPFWAGKQTKEGVEKVLDKLLKVDFDKDAEYAFVLDDDTVKPFPKPAGRVWPVTTSCDPHVPGQVLVRVAAGKRLSREELMDELNKSIQRADMFWPKKKK
jgi:hypothetical protein